MNNTCPLCGGELRILTGNAYCEDCNTVFKYRGNLGYVKTEYREERKDK